MTLQARVDSIRRTNYDNIHHAMERSALVFERDPELRVKAKRALRDAARRTGSPLRMASSVEYRDAEDRALAHYRTQRSVAKRQRRRDALCGVDLGGEA